MNETVEHTPVLIREVAELAQHRQRIVDATAGGGGHLSAFLDVGAKVLAVDRDPDAIATVQSRHGDRVESFCVPFDDATVQAAVLAFRPDLVLFDLGVSSHQIDADTRGFSFRPGVPLDMRMGHPDGPTAADYLNSKSLGSLHETFRDYGDERRSGSLAHEVVRRRQSQSFAVSDDLVNAIRAVLGARSGPSDFARLFQAVRIAVNDELGSLARALPAMRDALVDGGEMAVITYHSGEDRVVKNMFREWGKACVCPPQIPQCKCRGVPLGKVMTKKPIRPSAGEVSDNPRARSAKLRIFRRVDGA